MNLIGKEQWSSLSADVKGGAGQCFILIAAMIDAIAPQSGETICDPSCGSGSFMLSARDFLVKSLTVDPAQTKLRNRAFYGVELVVRFKRLFTQKLLLHGIVSETVNDPPVDRADTLAQPSGRKFGMILANPPFGKKGGYTIVGDDGKISTEKQEYERDEFWATTSNKQLNFLQHIVSELKIGGTAAVVLPDNVLFEGGAGETIRRELLKRCNVHTLLRLPTGIFYAQGVKANVLFFERKEASEKPWTKDLWIYDLRTNQHFTLKTNPLANKDLEDFKAVYQPGKFAKRTETDRFKKFTYDEIVAGDKANLDIFWLKDESLEDSENLPAPALLAAEIVESLEAALEEFRSVELALADNTEAV